MLTLVDSNPQFTVTGTGPVGPRGRLASICWLLTTLHAGFRFDSTAAKWVWTFFSQHEMSWNLFRFNSSLKTCKNTHRETHTHTQCRHSYPHPSTEAYMKQESRVMCTNYTYSIKQAAKKNSSSGENPREEPDKTRTWWEANHLDLSQQRDTFRKLQLGASFLLHMRKKNNPGSFYLSAVSCLNMKVVWATADRLVSNLIIIQTTVFMQITDPSSPFLTSFMWLDQ